MFLSMTGFGRASHTLAWGTVTLEIASVNHRYQEITVRLPKEIASFESSIVASLRSALKRGKIRLNAEIDWTGGYKTAVLDTDALCAYYNQLRKAAEQLKISPVSDLTNLLTLPGVCDEPRFHEENGEEPGKLLEMLTAAAVEALMEMKKSEGAKLREIVELDLREFERLLCALSARWNAASSESLESLKIRIEKVMERFDLEIDQNRIAQEVSLMADKWDVSEELKRLSSHVSKFKEITSGKDSEGRKLDFLIQEMNREVNTMGSKVADAEFRWMVVDAKSCLERIREQIQNVE